MLLDPDQFTTEEVLKLVASKLGLNIYFDLYGDEPANASETEVAEQLAEPSFDLYLFGELITKSKTKPFGSVWEKREEIAIKDIWDSYMTYISYGGTYDIRLFAYALATVRIECGSNMVPVREGFTESDEELRDFLMRRRKKYLATGKGPKYEYAYPSKVTGQVYGGRSYIQVTWEHNYRRLQKAISKLTGGKLDFDVYKDPEILMRNRELSGLVLFYGLESGFFNRGGQGSGLFYYLNKDDPVRGAIEARRTVNVLNKAELIASWYWDILDALEKSIIYL